MSSNNLYQQVKAPYRLVAAQITFQLSQQVQKIKRLISYLFLPLTSYSLHTLVDANG